MFIHIPTESVIYRPASEAALSLETAAKKFLENETKSGCKNLRQHLILRASCEISADCQSVLRNTYGTCNFGDICDLDFDSDRGNFCTTHQKYCKFQRCSYPKRILVKTNKLGPAVIP